MSKPNIEEMLINKRNFNTLQNAISNGMNYGYLVFRKLENNTPSIFCWRMFGDCIETKAFNIGIWERFDESKLNIKFDIGVFGNKQAWSFSNNEEH